MTELTVFPAKPTDKLRYKHIKYVHNSLKTEANYKNCAFFLGHAASSPVEQLALEPRLQPDPQRQLCGATKIVDDRSDL